MERKRDRKIGEAIKRAYEELDTKKRMANWDEKLEACAYVRHRDCYHGSEVPEIKVYTSSPEIYFNKYVSGMVGYLFPRSQQWARWAPRIGYGEASMADGHAMILDSSLSRMLEALDNMTFTVLSESNFYSEVKQMMNDWASIGTGCISVFDRGTPIPSYRSEDPQSFVIDSNEHREVDCYIRRFTLNASRCARIYGAGHELEASRENARSGSRLSDMDTILYEAVFERGYFTDPETFGEMEFIGSKRYVHIIYSDTDAEILSEKGYEEFPVAVPCRNRDSEKCFWEHGLAEDCLPDMRMLNDAENRKQIALQKITDPPMAVPYSMEGAYSGRPRSVNYTPDISQRPMPIQTITDYVGITNDVKQREDSLKYKMDVTLFETVMASGDSRKTATEVTMQENKSILLLALNIDNLLRDLVEPLLKRSLKIAIRNIGFNDSMSANRLISLIDSLHIEMNSVFVKRLNAYIQAESIVGSLNNLQVLASFAPSSLQAIDTDMYARLLLASGGLPAILFKDRKQLEEERQAQAEIQMQQLQAENEMKKAKANADNSKAIAGMNMQQEGMR